MIVLCLAGEKACTPSRCQGLPIAINFIADKLETYLIVTLWACRGKINVYCKYLRTIWIKLNRKSTRTRNPFSPALYFHDVWGNTNLHYSKPTCFRVSDAEMWALFRREHVSRCILVRSESLLPALDTMPYCAVITPPHLLFFLDNLTPQQDKLWVTLQEEDQWKETRWVGL